MAASDNLHPRLFGDDVGRITPEQEADARRRILNSHGNKDYKIVEQIANSTSIPTMDLHGLHNTSMRQMNNLDRDAYPDASGFAESPNIDAAKWLAHPDNEHSTGTDELNHERDWLTRDEIESKSRPNIAIHPAMLGNFGGIFSGGDLSEYGPKTITHEIGHALHSGRLPTHSRETSRSSEIRSIMYPASEGSAEGYAEKHTAPEAPNDSMYTPEFFSRSSRGSETPHGPELFERARDWTRSTGQGLDMDDFRKMRGLGSALSSDFNHEDYGNGLIVESSRRNEVGHSANDVGHRLLINEIDRRDPSVKSPKFEDERRKREMAIHGQDIQGSLFPDITPETNQYGDTPVDPSELALSLSGNMIKEKNEADSKRFRAWAEGQRRG